MERTIMKFKRAFYTDDTCAVFEIQGIPYYIKFHIEYDYDGVPSKAIIEEWNITDKKLEETKNASYVKWGGYPIFVQSEIIPMSDDGKEYFYLCTIDNDWGDSGNCNVFVLLEESEFGLIPKDVFLEASCH